MGAPSGPPMGDTGQMADLRQALVASPSVAEMVEAPIAGEGVPAHERERLRRVWLRAAWYSILINLVAGLTVPGSVSGGRVWYPYSVE